jgi:glutaminyl-tRNA synthetase
MEGDFKEYLNPDSLKRLVVHAEPSLASADHSVHYQFLRMGYFCLDKDSSPEKPVFNRTVTLRDMWAKEAKKGK